MASKRRGDSVARIKTGSFERRLTLTRAGLFAGTRMATHMATNWLGSKDTRDARHRAMLSSQAEFLVHELGKLKGSVVKIGQVMALYGEHFLPEEVTEALHTLEDQTTSLEWAAIHKVLVRELGADILAELEVEPEPIGAASLGQVHRARRTSDSLELVLKVQYPGVDEAVDSDLCFKILNVSFPALKLPKKSGTPILIQGPILSTSILIICVKKSIDNLIKNSSRPNLEWDSY